MQNNKPTNPARLEKGRLIDSIRGVVETWNWMVSCWENIKGVKGVKDGKPVIENSITVVGTDDVEVKGSKVKFESEDDSNVTLKASVGSDGVITIKVGVYYK